MLPLMMLKVSIQELQATRKTMFSGRLLPFFGLCFFFSSVCLAKLGKALVKRPKAAFVQPVVISHRKTPYRNMNTEHRDAAKLPKLTTRQP
ncbi:hypothetical protein QBC43DRAFT_55503 [Cladorrhinum sp. PSN259]|nr:hypothetical protein QBC43DRAFT_55503 [Cladorrhinum sp. PSN259]